MEEEIVLDAFPSPEELWQRYCAWKGLGEAERPVVEQDFYIGTDGKAPWYYQIIAISLKVRCAAGSSATIAAARVCRRPNGRPGHRLRANDDSCQTHSLQSTSHQLYGRSGTR